MSTRIDPYVIGYNVQEICNKLGELSNVVAGSNRLHDVDADAVASSTTSETVIAYLSTEQTFSRIIIAPTDAITAHNTNYATATIAARDGLGGAASTVCSFTTKITGGTGNWTAYVPVSITLSSPVTVAAGSVLTWTTTKAGSGVALPSLVVFAELE